MAYMTVDILRSRVPALVDPAAFPDLDLSDLISEFEDLAEQYRGVSYETKAGVVEKHELRGESVVWTDWPRLQSVTSVLVDLYGLTQTMNLAAVHVEVETGRIDLGSLFTSPVLTHGSFSGTATVTYTHGLTDPIPPGLLRACRLYVRACALRDQSTVGRDVLTQAFEGGGTTRYSTPDWKAGRPTGYLDVDSLLNQLRDYRRPGIG